MRLYRRKILYKSSTREGNISINKGTFSTNVSRLFGLKTLSLTNVDNSSNPNAKGSKGDCEKFSQMVNKNDSRLKFVFFFGFNHCGSTATGMILDAHPNAMVANEFDLFGELEKGHRVSQVIAGICTLSDTIGKKLEKHPRNPKGYSYKMGEGHGLFQGNLKLVGIRKSHVTLEHFQKNPSQFVKNYAK